MHWILLSIGIAIEVLATASLKLSDGFTKLGHCQIKLICYGELRIWTGFENRCLVICQAIQRALPNL